MRYRFSVPAIVLVLLISCSPHVDIIGDGGLLSADPSCTPPCFWGISPGVTEESQAWDILTSRGIAQSCKIWENTSNSGMRSIQCEFPSGGPNGSLGAISLGLDIQSDIISFVAFTPSNSITLQEMIEIYGTPDWVVVWEEGTPEHVAVDMTVFYDTISTRLDLPEQDGFIYDLQPDAMIYGVSYLSQEEYVEYLELIKDELQVWKDYGDY